MAQHPPRFLKIVNDAKQRVAKPTLTRSKPLDRGEKFTLIDVREDREYDADHLPGPSISARASSSATLRASTPS